MRCVWGKQLWESVGRGCRRLEMLWNLQADWIPAKKKKRERERERGKKEKTSDCRAILRKFWGVPKSPSSVRNHASPRKGPVSIPLMRWVTGGNSSYKVRSLSNTEMDSESSGGGPQPIPPPAVTAAHPQAFLSPIPTSKGRINLHKTS